MIIDTNIIIDLLKGHKKAHEFVYSHIKDDLYLSVITVSEVYSGIKNHEEELFEDLLTLFHLIQVNKRYP